jgi:hypothetical protein
MKLFLGLACLTGLAAGHGILVIPRVRTGQGNGVGIKVRGTLAEAVTKANLGCGAEWTPAANGDPGPGPPVANYLPGGSINVAWDVTIPHPADNLNFGIRVAVKYTDADSFAQNILAGEGATAGRPPAISAQVGGTGAKRQQLTVTLPPGKNSSAAVLQWMWGAQADGGFYLGCSDIKISNVPLPTPAPTPLPGTPTPPPTPPPAGPPTVAIKLEIRGNSRGASEADYTPAVLGQLKLSFANYYSTPAAPVLQTDIDIVVRAVAADRRRLLSLGSRRLAEAGVELTITIKTGDDTDAGRSAAKAAVNKSSKEGIVGVFANVNDLVGAEPVLTDWTMCNTGTTAGCQSQIQAGETGSGATLALIALAIPVVAVGVVIGLGPKKGRAMLLNGGDRS